MPPRKELSSPTKTSDSAARAQAVALEVPVTVHGARAVEGSDKREPFSETTTTVLVMGKGAVIRLSAPVTSGQLVFLTNAKTKKEVVCQVVKSKNYRNVSGYVELEFTEAVMGFWGLRFPADQTAAQWTPSAPGAATVEPASPAGRTEEKSGSTGANNASVLPFPRAAGPSAPAPAAAQFASTESLKSEAARLQSQLSSMTFGPAATKPVTPARAERKSPAPEAEAPRLTKSEPARPKETPAAKIPEVKSTLEVEEVKIPSWLEPLARNASAPTSAESEEPAPAKAAGPKAGQLERVREEAPALAADVDRAAGPAAKTAVAGIGSRLLNDNLALPAAKAPRGGNSATLVGAFAALLVLAAGAYWYLQPKSRTAVSSPTASESSSELDRSVPASPLQTVSANSKLPAGPAGKDAPDAAMNGTVAPQGALDATPREQQANVATSAYVANANKTAAKTNVTETSLREAQPADPLKPAVKKPNLGRVRLATPKLNGRVAESSTDAPSLDLGGQASPRGVALGNGLAAGPGTPVAPPSLPLGGDVKPARLSVSVAPVYPAIARSQRISGDVRIDALINVNGRVSDMKVISGPAVLHQAAMDALRHWKYVPATLDGNPVPMHLTVTIQFRLQ